MDQEYNLHNLLETNVRKLASYEGMDFSFSGLVYYPVKSQEPTISSDTILAIGAHPDDIEIGAGMTIDGLIDKHPIYYAICTNGERSSTGSEDRIRESNKAASDMGIRGVFYLGLPDTFLEKCWLEGYLKDRLDRICNLIGIPSTVFAHSTHDRHQDHVAVSNAVQVVYRKTQQMLLYTGPSGLTSFQPTYFTIFKRDSLDHKMMLLNDFESQVESKIIDIEKIAADTLHWCGMAVTHNHTAHKYAEAFEIVKYIRFQERESVIKSRDNAAHSLISEV